MEENIYRTELTPVSFLHRSAFVFPDKTAVVHGDRQYTYRKFAERVNRLASRLRRGGLAKQDRVAFLCPNTPALLEAHFAIPAAGGILVAVNTRLNSREIDYILKHSGARYLFVDAELQPLVQPLKLEGIQVVRIEDTGTPEDPYEGFLAEGAPEPVKSWLEDEEETIAIDYTSGTTGNPKGAVYTHRGAYLAALAQVIEAGLSGTSVFLWTLPMFHCNGWCYTWAVTAVGGTHVCLRKLDPGLVWELFDTEGVTHYNGAPTVHIFLVNHPKAHRLERPVTVAVGGAPPSPTLLGQMKALNIHPIHLYGLTETYGPYVICEWHSEWDPFPLGEQARLLARQGQSNAIADPLRVVDEAMNDVPKDGKTMGEVVMRGNHVMKGYYENPDATAAAFRGGAGHRPACRCSGVRCRCHARRDMGRTSQGVRLLEARAEGNRTGDHRLLPRAPGALQVPCCRRVWRLAQDLDREGAEVRIAREGVERTREAHPLAFLALLQDARGHQPEVPLEQLSSPEPT